MQGLPAEAQPKKLLLLVMGKGKRANKRGKILENAVLDLLVEEHEKVESRKFLALKNLRQPLFARQCSVGKDVYGKNRRVDFILYHPQRWPDCLVIQCKWQSSGGSVEEKYPFEVMSIECNEFPTIIVLDGGGYSKESEAWLKGQVGKGKGKGRLIHVFSLGEMGKFQSSGGL